MSSQMPTADELSALKRRLDEVEAALARRPAARTRRPVALALAVGLVAGATVAVGASGTCPNGLPRCFVANSPANAEDVNLNFATVKEWVEAKVGAVAAGNPSTSNITTSGVNVTSGGNITLANGALNGTNASNNFHIDNTVQSGRLYLNWFKGTGGVVFGNGNAAIGPGAEVAKMDGAGKLTLSNGLVGGGKICIQATECVWEGDFGCGNSATCSAGRVMVGSKDGTSCNVFNQLYCCKLALTTSC